ncbi:MAG: hypothetical protein NC095_09725 [Muribaculum sp.]|nr:hypothetical protein [Muribaculum sp.]
MFFRKRKKDKPSKFASSLYLDVVNPLMNHIKQITRFSGRRKLVNRWIRKNPKKFVWTYTAVGLVIIMVNIVRIFMPDDNRTDDSRKSFAELSSIQPLRDQLNYLSTYDNNVEKIKRIMSEFGQTGVEMYQEMDSLIRLQVKTRSDSIRIWNLYEILNRTFNNNNQYESEKN